MKSSGTVVFTCDEAGCGSSCALSHPADLRGYAAALKARGWVCVGAGEAEKHYCPIHVPATPAPAAK